MPVRNATKMMIFQTDATKAALIRILRDIWFEKKNLGRVNLSRADASKEPKKHPKIYNNQQSTTTHQHHTINNMSAQSGGGEPDAVTHGSPPPPPAAAPAWERERETSQRRRGVGRVDKDAPSPPTQRFIPVQKKEKKSPFLGSARLIGCRFF